MSETSKRIRKPINDDARESQMVNLAMDAAEKQLREGTASSQLITHFLKLGSSREKAERELLLKQGKLADAKIESLKSEKEQGIFYQDAVRAMSLYSGENSDDEYED